MIESRTNLLLLFKCHQKNLNHQRFTGHPNETANKYCKLLVSFLFFFHEGEVAATADGVIDVYRMHLSNKQLVSSLAPVKVDADFPSVKTLMASIHLHPFTITASPTIMRRPLKVMILRKMSSNLFPGLME